MDHYIGQLVNQIISMGYEVILNHNQVTGVYIVNLIDGSKQLGCYTSDNLLWALDSAHCEAEDNYNRRNHLGIYKQLGQL